MSKYISKSSNKLPKISILQNLILLFHLLFFKKIFPFLLFSIFSFLLISNISTSVFADFEPNNPRPPNIPTPSGLQDNDNFLSQSSIQSLNSSISNSINISSNSSISSSLISQNFSSSNISAISSSTLSNSSQSSPNSNQILTNLSNSSVSSSSKVSIPEMVQDNTVRSGGFSSFLFIFGLIGGVFGFRYLQIKNRTLKMAEKKIK